MRFRFLLALLVVLSSASVSCGATLQLIAADSTDNTLLTFQINGAGAPVHTGTISSGLSSPSKMAISSNNELFVSNGGASINRYLGLGGTLTPNPSFPTIPDSNAPDGFNFDGPNGIAFRNNELFNVNISSNQVLRFNFSGSGAPIANLPSTSTSALTSTRARGLGFSPSGDRMYLTACCSSTPALAVYSVNLAGTVTLLNTISTANFSSAGISIQNLQGLTVSPTGELWLADTGSVDADSEIIRLTLTAGGAISTASVAIPGSNANLFRPQDLAFSEDGELFVSNIGVTATLNDGFLSRFTFDGGGAILTSSTFGPAGDYSGVILFTIPVPAPEPSSCLLLGLGSCLCLRNFRRRRGV